MQAFLMLGLSAFVLCLVLTPICRDIFLRAGFVDQPDGNRKFHRRAVPRVGGLPIVISYAAALFFTFHIHSLKGTIYVQHEKLFLSLLPASAIVFFTGLLDDVINLKPWQKLIGQLIAAALAVSLGARLSLTHFPGWVSSLLSLAWLVGCTNAVNLIDGMDGLATGVGLLATTTMLFAALLSGNVGLALATAPLMGALLGFLRYNFSPASVFLGDCGSLTIGFILGCFGLIWSQHSGTMLGMVAPLMALALPLLDVLLAIGRRFLRRVPLFKPDRSHIHHRVLSLGFTTRRAALVLYAVCGVYAMLAMLESFGYRQMFWPILLVFCVFVLIGIQRLGYVEFIAAGRALSHKFMRRALHDEIYLEDLDRALHRAHTLEDWWTIIRIVCTDLNIISAQIQLDGRFLQARFNQNPDAPLCTIRVTLGKRGELLLTRSPETSTPRILMAVIDRLHSDIHKKPLSVDKGFRDDYMLNDALRKSPIHRITNNKAA